MGDYRHHSHTKDSNLAHYQRAGPNHFLPPSLTIQRPSYSHQSSLPPLQTVRPSSISSSSVLRRPSYSSSAPIHPSGLRYPARKSPSISPTFDLSRYSMEDNRKSVSPAGAPSTSSRNVLPPLRLPSPTSPSNGSIFDSRKRAREDDVATPTSTPSSSSQTVVTPQSDSAPPSKRRGSNIENLLTNDVDVKPVINPSWNDWQRRGSIGSYFGLPEKANDKLANMPIAPQQPIIAFPLQFPYSASGPAPNNANPSTPIDPALSSVRTNTDQMTGVNAAIPPELRFTDETLHSATSSPGAAVLEAALQHAHAAGVSNEEQIVSPDIEALRREQPFSRSPELRISHKLAERKRRKEMKDLFDELRDHLPAERGSKSSKWEILSKAIDYIGQLKKDNAGLNQAVNELKGELENSRMESQGMRPWTQYGQFPANGSQTNATPSTSATVTVPGEVNDTNDKVE